MEIEETHKFISRSQRRFKEMEEERVVEEALLPEAQPNLKDMLEKQEKVPARSEHPEDVAAQVTNLQQMVNLLQSERFALADQLDMRGMVRQVAKSHPPQMSVEATEHLESRAGKRKACGPEVVPSSEQELAEWLCNKHLEVRDGLEMGSHEMVVELSQLIAEEAKNMQALSGRPLAMSNMVP